MCLFNESTTLPGKDGNSLQRLRIKVQCTLEDLNFLRECKKNNLTPSFIRLSSNQHSSQANKILNFAKKKLLNNAIRNTEAKLSRTEMELYVLHRTLSASLHRSIWDHIDTISWQQATTAKHIKRIKLSKKLHDLKTSASPISPTILSTRNTDNLDLPTNSFSTISDQPLSPPPPSNPKIVNISSTSLSKTHHNLLEKGLNFSITPSKTPTEDIISDLEQCFKQLDQENRDTLRQIVKNNLQHAPKIRANLNKEEFSALKELRSNENITITRADKGGAIVILDTSTYENKVSELLQGPEYIPLSKNPCNSINTKLRNLIKSSNSIPTPQKYFLTPSHFLAPKFYALPKIHKPTLSFRPIVSNVNSPTHPLSSYLSKTVSPFVGRNLYSVKNSKHFVSNISKVILDPTDILISCDVENLFTKTPVNDSLSALEITLKQNSNLSSDEISDILSLSRFCTDHTFFTWKNKFYKQKDGLPMGSCLSPSLSNLFMESFEERALSTATLKPKLWNRYMDDTFVIWPHGKETIPAFIDHLNSIHPAIKFSFEIESNKCLPFLDVLVSKNDDGSLSTSVYRKPCQTNNFINSSSCHHPSQKTSFIRTLTNRAFSICSSESAIKEEINFIKSAAAQNGFLPELVDKAVHKERNKIKLQSLTNLVPIKSDLSNQNLVFLPFIPGLSSKLAKQLKNVANIKTIFRPNSKLNNYLSKIKDANTTLDKHGIYNIPCECGLSYVGQTRRKLSTRIDEHKKQIHNNSGFLSSALAEHSLDHNHKIHWHLAKIIAQPKFQIARNTRESLEIFKLGSNALNREAGPKNINSWKSLFKFPHPTQPPSVSVTPANTINFQTTKPPSLQSPPQIMSRSSPSPSHPHSKNTAPPQTLEQQINRQCSSKKRKTPFNDQQVTIPAGRYNLRSTVPHVRRGSDEVLRGGTKRL